MLNDNETKTVTGPYFKLQMVQYLIPIFSSVSAYNLE